MLRFLSCTALVCYLFLSGHNQCQAPRIPLAVLFGNPEKTFVRISPDGTKLAYLAPYNGILNVWIKTIGFDDDHAITHAVGRGIHMFSWVKNSGAILFVTDKNGNENWHIFKTDLITLETIDLTPFEGVKAQIHSTSKYFPNNILITMNRENPKFFDVYNLDLTTGKIELVLKNQGTMIGWLADRNLTIRATIITKQDGNRSLLLRDTAEGEWEEKLNWNIDDSTNCEPLGFSRNGKVLYLKDSLGADTQRLVKLDLVMGTRTIIASDESYDISSVIFNTNTYEPEAVSFEQDRKVWKVLSPAVTDDFKTITKVDKGDLTYIIPSDDQNIWVLCFAHDNGPCSYYLYDRLTKKTEFLFYDKPALIDYKLASMRPIQFISRDKLLLHGYLTCPLTQPCKNLPLVLFVHGGPQIRDTWGYNSIVQWLANRGYACLQINFRGSTGYGKQFVNAGNREWGGKMHDDLIDAVNWAISSGVANPKKIAIFGSSYGGYAALVGAAFTPDVFCCAIDLFGISNLLSFLNTIPPYWEAGKIALYKRIGNPQTDIVFLKSRSPLFKADQIKIPIFIAQGANDPRVKQEESEQLVAAIKARGITYKYMLFPDEGHGLARPENRIAFFEAAEKFLATYLGTR